jgi:hypothetical protein
MDVKEAEVWRSWQQILHTLTDSSVKSKVLFQVLHHMALQIFPATVKVNSIQYCVQALTVVTANIFVAFKSC